MLKSGENWRVIQGNVFDVLPTLPPGSVDCMVTSPPYWMLRSYLPKGHALKHLELGSEPTPAKYIENQVAVMRLVRDALTDEGTAWINVGDSYSSKPVGSFNGGSKLLAGRDLSGHEEGSGVDKTLSGIPAGNLCLIPQRLAIALQDDGWLVRSVIIWHKPCLTGGTVIYVKSQKGEMPMTIKDAARLDPKTVKLWDGEKWNQVVGWNRTKKANNLLGLCLRSGQKIECTSNHRFPTECGLLEARELKVGDKLIRCQLPEPVTPHRPPALTWDLAWFIGLYIAEGSIDGTRKTISLAGHVRETERWDRVRKIAEYYGGTATLTNSGNNQTIRVYSAILVAFLDQYVNGGTAKTKSLKVKTWTHDNIWLKHVLDGYLSGDGHWDNKNQRWRIGFARNDSLARDIRTIAARLGIHLVLNQRKTTFNGKTFPTCVGEIRYSRNGHHNEKSPNEIVGISKVTARDVWDVEVESEPHLFALTSGILSHNSAMPASLSGWRWVRCRVKVKAQGKSGLKLDSAGIGNSPPWPGNGIIRDAAEFADCPGCRKCEPHGGFVLRRGSWRPTSSYEPILMLAKTDRYYCDGDAVKQPAKSATIARNEYTRVIDDPDEQFAVAHDHETTGDTANLRDVWTIAAEPLREKHYAAFPTELASRCIQAGTSQEGYCRACGKPWVRRIERVDTGRKQKMGDGWDTGEGGHGSIHRNGAEKGERDQPVMEDKTLGWKPSCKCPDPTPRPGVVLDPFAGSGRTAIAARRLFRGFVGCELNEEYVNLAERRIRNDAPLFNAS